MGFLPTLCKPIPKSKAMLLKHGLSDVEFNGYLVFKLKGMLIGLIFF